MSGHALTHRLLSLIFGKPEEINGGERCPTYMYRWPIIHRKSGRGVYVHQFVSDDWSLDLHDHPKRFISIGLWGRYVEHTPCSLGHVSCISGDMREWRAPWVRSFPATHTHRLSGPSLKRPCWTLVIVGKPVREWGFWSSGIWIWWKTYVGSDTATQRKTC